MSTSIVWAANGHELLKLEAGEDESAMKQRIQAAFGIPADLQRLERREEDGAYLLYVKLRGGCRRRLGAGLSCPCFGCHISACSVQ